ncbi:hypothetical protein LguiB_017865 [Lonicera macranthoides]
MAIDDPKLHVLFLPYFTPSHIIPLVDAGRLFASRGINTTIITTPYNARLFQATVDRDIALGHQISVRELQFPRTEVDLAEGIENFSTVGLSEASKVSKAIALLQKPMEQLIRDLSPDCIFSDMFFPWTVDLAEELKIPRLIFYPSCFFYHCASHSLKVYTPYESVESESENFLVPFLPDKIEMKKSQLQDYVKMKTMFGEFINLITESEMRSFGSVHDTFYELEPAYVDHYKKVKGTKQWHIGPLFNLSNRDTGDEQHICLNWLETQRPNSVLYVCFGSMVRFTDAQLNEIALALEASKCPFIWVVRNKCKTQEDEKEGWLPEGFEERMVECNKGMIIREWVPQLKILNHFAIGGFMTHCGWNSILEAITAGVPLIMWPLFAEQFYNEKLIDLVGIGVRVGNEVWNPWFVIKSPLIRSDSICEAITHLMGCSVEAEHIRGNAKEMAEMAKRAVAKGGSSYTNLTALIEEIKACTAEKS